MGTSLRVSKCPVNRSTGCDGPDGCFETRDLVCLSYLTLPVDEGRPRTGSLEFLRPLSCSVVLLPSSILRPSLSLEVPLPSDAHAKVAALLVTGFSVIGVEGAEVFVGGAALGVSFLPALKVCNIVLFSGLGLREDFFILWPGTKVGVEDVVVTAAGRGPDEEMRPGTVELDMTLPTTASSELRRLLTGGRCGSAGAA